VELRLQLFHHGNPSASSDSARQLRDWNERGHQAKGLGRQRRLDRVLSRQHFDPVGSDPFRRRPAKPNLSVHLADRGAGHDRGGRNGHLFLPHLQVQLGERRQLGHADRHLDRVLGRCYPHLRRPVLPGLHRGRERGRHLHEDEQRKLRGQRDDRHHQRRNIGSGLLGLARGETHTDLSATGETSRFLKQAATGSDITVVRRACADLSDSAGGCSKSTIAGGDLSGTLPSPTVAKSDGTSFTGTNGNLVKTGMDDDQRSCSAFWRRFQGDVGLTSLR